MKSRNLWPSHCSLYGQTYSHESLMKGKMCLLTYKMCENGITYSFCFLNSSLKKHFNEYEYCINLNAITVLIKACSIFCFIYSLKQNQKENHRFLISNLVKRLIERLKKISLSLGPVKLSIPTLGYVFQFKYILCFCKYLYKFLIVRNRSKYSLLS